MLSASPAGNQEVALRTTVRTAQSVFATALRIGLRDRQPIDCEIRIGVLRASDRTSITSNRMLGRVDPLDSERINHAGKIRLASCDGYGRVRTPPRQRRVPYARRQGRVCRLRGVRTNALITGNVDTPLYRRLSGLGPHDALPPAPNPTGRTTTAEEIASFVAYLLSDETTFITGAALTADGGYTAS
jgi:Enoyl-(Acyl carrier protein) reductase